MQHENLYGTNEQYASLQAGREIMAIRESQGQQRTALQNLDRVTDPNISLSQIRPGEGLDTGVITADDCLGIEAFGLDAPSYIQKANQTPVLEPVEQLVIGDNTLTISRYNDGLNVSLSGDNIASQSSAEPSPLLHIVQERFRQSPAHAAVNKLATKLGEGAWPLEISTEPFATNTDPMGTLAFLQDCMVGDPSYSSTDIADSLRKGIAPQAIVDDITATMFGPASGPTNKTLTFSWGEGAIRTLMYKPDEATLALSIRQSPIDNYGEKASGNSSYEWESLPFIETETAKILLSELDSAGLTLNPRIQSTIMDVSSAERYGSVYTAMTRELGKWVTNPERVQVTNLFVPKVSTPLGRELVEAERPDTAAITAANQIETDPRLEAKARELLLAMQLRSEYAPVESLIGIAQGSLIRHLGADGTPLTALPVTEQHLSMREGSCFDVFSYYSDFITSRGYHRGKLTLEDHHDASLLHKQNHGKESYLTIEPMLFNGVGLPKGSLLIKNKQDGGWAFSRLTPFSFDDPGEQKAFGSEVTAAYNQEYRIVQEMGKSSIESLVISATEPTRSVWVRRVRSA